MHRRTWACIFGADLFLVFSLAAQVVFRKRWVLIPSLVISDFVLTAQGTDDRVPGHLSDSFGCKMTFFPGSLFSSSYVQLEGVLVVSTPFSPSLPASSHFLCFTSVPFSCPWLCPSSSLSFALSSLSLWAVAGATLLFQPEKPTLTRQAPLNCSPHSKIPCALLPRVSLIKTNCRRV